MCPPGSQVWKQEGCSVVDVAPHTCWQSLGLLPWGLLTGQLHGGGGGEGGA